MVLLTGGINHHSAHVAIREQIAFDNTRTITVLRDLLQHKAANEAVLLSTCNRTEIYATTDQPEQLQQWFLAQYNGEHSINSYCYWHQELDGIQHLMRVASGLDSMILGEPQILGQIKQAYHLACDVGSVGSELKQLFPAVFSTSKLIRQHTSIGANPVSLAYATVQLGKRIFDQLQHKTILLVGAGKQMELIATHLLNQGSNHFIIANRNLNRAQQLAHYLNGQAIQLSDIPNYLHQTDIVICATGSQLPLIGKGMVESAITLRKRRPIFMVDLAVPRDIEPEVAALEDIYLYNIDDLQTIIETNRQDRHAAAQQAEAIINTQAELFLRHRHIHHAREVIQQFRQRMDTLRQYEVDKALRALTSGQDPQEVVQLLARNLSNKMLHQPTIKLRQAASAEQRHILDLTKALLND